MIGSIRGMDGPPGRNQDVLHFEKTVLLPQMASNVFSTVQNSQNFIRLRGTHFTHQKRLKLFFATALLESAAMDLFDP